jgi:hypothetical protein
VGARDGGALDDQEEDGGSWATLVERHSTSRLGRSARARLDYGQEESGGDMKLMMNWMTR